MDAEAGLRERDPRRAEGGCLDRAAGERLHGFWVSTLPEAVLRVVAFTPTLLFWEDGAQHGRD